MSTIQVFRRKIGLRYLLPLGLSALLFVSCDKKNNETPEPYPVTTFRTKLPISGFYKVSKVEVRTLSRETEQDGLPWKLDENYLLWGIQMPLVEVACSETKAVEEYKSLCSTYGIRDDINFYSPNPIPKLYLAQGIRSISVCLQDTQTKERRDLSDKVTIECKAGMQTWFADPKLAGEKLLYPRNPWGQLRGTLSQLSGVDLRWGFWSSDYKEHNTLDRIFLNKAGIDVTKGKLLLILEREGNQPLEVELPQK